MGSQFQTIIAYFNQMNESHIFTSVDMKKALFDVVKPATIYSFLTTAFRMGIIEKEAIKNPVGRGPKVNYMKGRSLNDDEIKRMTTYPDCISFKKEIDIAYESGIKRAEEFVSIDVPEEIAQPVTAKEPVIVKKHTRKKPSDRTPPSEKFTVANHKDRTVITIFK